LTQKKKRRKWTTRKRRSIGDETAKRPTMQTQEKTTSMTKTMTMTMRRRRHWQRPRHSAPPGPGPPTSRRPHRRPESKPRRNPVQTVAAQTTTTTTTQRETTRRPMTTMKKQQMMLKRTNRGYRRRRRRRDSDPRAVPRRRARSTVWRADCVSAETKNRMFGNQENDIDFLQKKIITRANSEQSSVKMRTRYGKKRDLCTDDSNLFAPTQ
jgi:hypothetical protein